jgi:hypothetical protein
LDAAASKGKDDMDINQLNEEEANQYHQCEYAGACDGEWEIDAMAKEGKERANQREHFQDHVTLAGSTAIHQDSAPTKAKGKGRMANERDSVILQDWETKEKEHRRDSKEHATSAAIGVTQ